MFILDDSTFTAGSMQVATMVNYETPTVGAVSDLIEGSDSSGDYRIWAFNESGSGISWKTMSDGTLVEANDNILKTTVESIAFYSPDYGGSSTILSEYPLSSGSVISQTQSRMLHYYCEGTINGGEYTIKLFYPGYTTNEFQQSDLYKIVVGTGIENWNATRYLPSMFTSTLTSARALCMTPSGTTENVTRSRADDASQYPASVRMYAIPKNTAPIITPEQVDLGVITDPTSQVFQVNGSPTVTVSWDNGVDEPVSPGVGNFTIDMSQKWGSLGYGSHTALIKAKYNGYTCGAKMTFSKSSSVVQVTTNTQNSANRPIMCRLVDSVVVPDGAVISRAVTCNANDDNPIWEPYTGHPHVFSNTTKTATNWGLAARVGIDNSSGTSNAEIQKAIALGVLYEYEE